MLNLIVGLQTAEIPILDWKGPAFLIFYGAAFVVALVWSISRRAKMMEKFIVPRGALTSLINPYEAAYLAGGAPRCIQLAVVRLLQRGALQGEVPRFGANRVLARETNPAELNDIEQAVYDEAVRLGRKGLLMQNIGALVTSRLGRIESRLATLGLRPTNQERSGMGFMIALPLVMLLLIGATKLIVGISRDKPVMFLVIALVITFIAAIGMGSSAKRLTPAGELLLDKMRADYRSSSRDRDGADLTALSLGMALLGPSVISGYGHLIALDPSLKKDITQMGVQGSAGGDGGSGCSSGCGGSGCGGGCGGCGGD